MKHLKKFEQKALYESYISNSPTLPNVSYVEEDNIVYYNPYVIDTTIDTTGFANGVYAVSADYKLIDYKTADESCIGVALITDNQKIMIEKNGEANTDIIKAAYEADGATDTSYQRFYWGSNTDITSITNSKNSDAAKQDFNGKANTVAIIATPNTDNNMECANMGTYCIKFNEMSGTYEDWYIPASGQLYEIYKNVTDIDIALSNIGGTNFNMSNFYWSSSEYLSSQACGVYFSYGSVDGYDKKARFLVRLIRDI